MHLRDTIDRILSAGTEGYSQEARRRLSVVNLIGYLIILASLNYVAIYATFGYQAYWTLIVVNLVLSGLASLVPFLHRFGENVAGLYIVAFEYIGLFYLTALLGQDSGIQMNYLIAAAVPFLAFDRRKPALIFGIIGVGLVLHLAARFALPLDRAMIQADEILLANIYVMTAVTAFGLIAAIVYYALLLKDRAEARTEELLRNILPVSIAERLKANPTANIAENYDQAAVLFADAVGYTSLSHEMGAEQTVAILNDVFTAFDELAEQHGLEKIKTVGDAYMAVSGAPQAIPDPAQHVASMALSLLGAIETIAAKHTIPLALRIGIATGPLVGGVIGRQKLLFDVWGDTVNLAARLQTYGVAGEIHICHDTAKLLKGQFLIERRGVIELKGIGEVESWVLTGNSLTGEESQSPVRESAVEPQGGSCEPVTKSG